MRNTIGDGDYCPHNGHHGRMLITSSKRQWCPHQSHDMDGTPSFYDGATSEKVVEGDRKRRGRVR